jgi:N-acetylmuramoyl-L-alanine amidase
MKKILSLIMGIGSLGILASCSGPTSHSELAMPANRSEAYQLGHKAGPRGFRTIILDAGHGGKDSGAAQYGMQEKQLALDVVRRVQGKLSGQFRVQLIRSGDQFIDLDQRVVMANRFPDAVLVSVHFNSGPSSLVGAETFYWRVDSYGLATKLQRELSRVTPADNSRGLVRRRLRLTRNPTLPCVLVECGYMSNPQEASLIKQSGYRDRLAEAIASALRDQASQGDGNIGPLPPPRSDPPSKASDPRDSP